MISLLNAAPEVDGLAGKLGGMGSMLSGGSDSSSLGALSSLAGSFSNLGMDSGMIEKFIPVVLEYVKGNGGMMQ